MKWTPEKVELLKANYEKYTNKELAEMLGVTYRSVEYKLYNLRITRLPESIRAINIRTRVRGEKHGKWKGGIKTLDPPKYSRLRRQRGAEHFLKQEKCRYLVRCALKKGILKKEPCAVCGVVKVDGHHEDYDKPLEVIWLCRKCHTALGKKLEDSNGLS